MARPESSQKGPESVPTGSEKSETLRLLEAQMEAKREAITNKSKSDRGFLQSDIFKGLEKMLEQVGSVFQDAKKHLNEMFEKVFGFKLFGKETAAVAVETGAISAAVLQEKLKAAPHEIKKVFSEHPDWWDHLAEAEQSYGVPKSLILAVMKRESNFDPHAKVSESNARGLGQFIPSTWESFRQENKNFADVNPFDARASFFATAWYLKTLSGQLGINLHGPDAAARLYEAYHEGPDRYKQLLKYRAGKGGITVPSSYAARFSTPEKYANFIKKTGEEVQAYAEKYAEFFTA